LVKLRLVLDEGTFEQLLKTALAEQRNVADQAMVLIRQALPPPATAVVIVDPDHYTTPAYRRPGLPASTPS
jgi:hypothetical protein